MRKQQGSINILPKTIFILFFISLNFSLTEGIIFDIQDNRQDVIIYGITPWDRLGDSLAYGDINGDGIDDLIIGTYAGKGPNDSRYSCGNVYIIYGGTIDQIKDLAEKEGYDVVLYGAQSGDYLGSSVACGDINGDGIDDLIIGASSSSGPGDLRSDCGEVDVIYGRKGLPKVWDFRETNPDIIIYGREVNDFMGWYLSSGDINGDKKDDIIISVSNGDGPLGEVRVNAGEIYVIYGSENLSSPRDLNSALPDLVVYGADYNDHLDYCPAGDINGDGKDDLFCSARGADGSENLRINAGEVYLIFGGNDLPSIWDLKYSTANVTILGADKYDNLILRSCGDVNNDGYRDILLTGSGGDGPDGIRENAGEAYVIFGKSSLPATYDLNNSQPGLIVYGREAGNYLSGGVLSDVNGDRIDDIILGAAEAYGPDNSRKECGEVYVIYGDSSLGGIIDLNLQKPDILVYGCYKDKIGGTMSLAAGGDLNNDGIGDIFIGAPYADGPQNTRREASGEVYIIYGWRSLESPGVNIESNKSMTDRLQASLLLSVGGDPAQMCISGDISDDFRDKWIEYAAAQQVSLTGEEGLKTVTAKFRNALGRESELVSDSIDLNIRFSKLVPIDNYFNPNKNEKSVFQYNNAKSGKVEIKVYDLAGVLVKKLLDDDRPVETGIIEWDGKNDFGRVVASGIYLLVIEAGTFMETKKIFVVE